MLFSTYIGESKNDFKMYIKKKNKPLSPFFLIYRVKSGDECCRVFDTILFRTLQNISA